MQDKPAWVFARQVRQVFPVQVLCQFPLLNSIFPNNVHLLIHSPLPPGSWGFWRMGFWCPLVYAAMGSDAWSFASLKQKKGMLLLFTAKIEIQCHVPIILCSYVTGKQEIVREPLWYNSNFQDSMLFNRDWATHNILQNKVILGQDGSWCLLHNWHKNITGFEINTSPSTTGR